MPMAGQEMSFIQKFFEIKKMMSYYGERSEPSLASATIQK
jgi:hypothetical protein